MFKYSAYSTLFISILNVIDSLGFNINFIHYLPLNSLGFNWVLPAIIGGLIGKFIIKEKTQNETLDKISA